MPPTRGFSLIEVLVVVALFAVATGVLSLTLGGGLKGRQLRAAAQEVASQLNYVRAQALVSGQTQVFTLDTETRRWQAAGKKQGELPKAISVEVITARQEMLTPTAASIRFFPDGSATGGGVTMISGTAQWRVSVDWLTGRVRTERGEAP